MTVDGVRPPAYFTFYDDECVSSCESTDLCLGIGVSVYDDYCAFYVMYDQSKSRGSILEPLRLIPHEERLFVYGDEFMGSIRNGTEYITKGSTVQRLRL